MARSTPADLERLALTMPEAVRDVTDAGRASFLVRGKGFVISRSPRKDALDEQGQRLTDVLLFRCCGPEDKAALLQDESSPFFTTPHFNGYDAVLLREPHLPDVPLDVLAEVVADAWLAVAPRRVAETWLATRGVRLD